VLTRTIQQLLSDHFRCPAAFPVSALEGDLSSELGSLRCDSDTISGDTLSSGPLAALMANALHAASAPARVEGLTVQHSFDAAQVVDYLRFERYVADSTESNKSKFITSGAVRKIYYAARPMIPMGLRKQFQKIYFRGWEKVRFPNWPVDRTVERIFEQLLVFAMKSWNVDRVPFVWFWPDGARSCAIMTHDVETTAGLRFCPQLMDLNDSFGIKASFQIVPEERYEVPSSLLENIRKRGFEVNVHDLNHDGGLFSDRLEFLRRAELINRYGQQFGSEGFRSAILYHNADWYDALKFSYDMSIPNVAHLDPQPGGCCTVLPFFIGKILELPVTATQDYSLFNILHDYSIRLWKEQISLIQEDYGLISFIVHPDYIISGCARRIYVELLSYLASLRSNGSMWMALPRDVATWWRSRNEMNLVKTNGAWSIEGKGSERARIAYAVLQNDRITYQIDSASNVTK
jgi:hypothetical protein